jgi:low affinity Fe/Cu permease
MSCWEVLVESIAVALIGIVTLVGVIASNSRSRAVMELKIDELTRRVEKHNCLIERTYKLEQDMAVVRRDVDALEERNGR